MGVNIWEVINRLTILINREYVDSPKKKDCFVWAIFFQIGIILSSVSVMIKPLINSVFELINNLKRFVEGEQLSPTYILNDSIVGVLDFRIWFIVFFTCIVVCLLLKCNIRRIYVFFLCEIIQILLFVFFFIEARYIFCLVLFIALFVTLFFPIGSGVYFNLFKYMNYIIDIFEYEENSQKKWKRMLFGIGFCWLCLAIILKILFPFFTLNILILLLASITLLLWINSSTGKIRDYLKKILVYAFFIPFVLLSNNFFEVSIQNIVLVIISIYFAIERVINIIKLIVQKIENESLRFLLDEKKGEDLIKERIVIDRQMQEYISEKMLIRQIVISFKLGLEDISTLIQMYRERACVRESMLVGAIEYYIEKQEELSLEQRREELDIICERNAGDICFIPILEEYAYVLYCLRDGYDRIILLLDTFTLEISDNSKYILYYSYKKMNRNSEAYVVKREINNFEQIEIKMKYDEETNEEDV